MLTAGWRDQEVKTKRTFEALATVVCWQEAAVLAFWVAGTDGGSDN